MLKYRPASPTRLLSTSLCLLLCACSSNDLPLGPDHDEDGWPAQLDCNDDDPAIFPSADDPPGDGVDQDCSGGDSDGPGGAGGSDCSGEPCASGGGAGVAVDEDEDGFTPNAGDCDDDDPAIHPGARDVPGDGIDQDCFGGDSKDFDQDGHDGGAEGDDCDDEDAAIHPRRLEIVLDGIDQNCDGSDLPGFGEPESVLSEAAVPADPPDLAVGELAGEAVMLAVWADSRVAPRQDLYARLLDADGAPAGPEIAVETSDNHGKSGVRVATKGDGFLVTWSTSEGVWVRRLDADGNPNGIALGYGDAGGAEPWPAFGGGNWAVAWLRPGASAASIRAMTTDGVRGDILDLGGTTVSGVALAGNSQGFLAAWSGSLATTSAAGISAQLRSSVGAAEESAFDVITGAESPAVTDASAGYQIVGRKTGGLGYVVGQTITEAGALVGDAQRLSSESNAQVHLRLARGGTQFFTAWEDFRHAAGPLSAQAIYGNALDSVGDPWVAAGVGLVADASAKLGGLALTDDAAWLSVQTSQGTGLVRVARP